MNFDEYQSQTLETAIYPGAGGGEMQAITYLGLGLGEAGEIQGKIKKVLRDNGGRITTAQRIEIAAELGDLQWYVARMADELGLTLSTVARMNLAKLSDRKERGVLQGSGDER